MPMDRCGRETTTFVVTLTALIVLLLHESILFGRVLSPADILLVSRSFGGTDHARYEPANRLLSDPVLQFEPWLEFNRTMIRSGRLPLWNPYAGNGAPHLANGQSGVFDPFHLVAYLTPLPHALGWIAALRLLVAGTGMFGLARTWGLGVSGRWFAGLTFPFCGFFVGWLQYPVASSGAWIAWILWATHRVIMSTGDHRRDISWLALVVAATLLGGHVQTSAHALLAGLGYAVWLAWPSRCEGSGRALIRWMAGILLGVAIAAVQLVPLAAYLTRSPVWADRSSERASVFAVEKPRALDAVSTALPYAFGSQMRGHPNLARALGVHNINESAGGFTGLVSLLWLAPLGLAARRSAPVVTFLAGLVVIGFMGSYGLAPISNLLRSVPILDVMDHRRLGLYIALGITGLAAIGLDRAVRQVSTSLLVPRRGWTLVWVAIAATLVAAGTAVRWAEPQLRTRAIDHYTRVAEAGPAVDRAHVLERADRQVDHTLSFLPKYYLLISGQLVLMAGLAWLARRGQLGWAALGSSLVCLALIELVAAAWGRNPSIDLAAYRPRSEVVDYLRREVPPPGRVIAIGAELPPNVLMRYGLADARNYDSVELSTNLDWLDPIYDGSGARTSRRPTTWASVARGLDRLQAANVRAIVGASQPPEGLFDRVESVGDVWIARLEPSNLTPRVWLDQGPQSIAVRASSDAIVRTSTTYTPGWGARGEDGRQRPVICGPDGLLSIQAEPGDQHLTVVYDPLEFRLGAAVSSVALVLTVLASIGPGRVDARHRKNPNGTWKPQTRVVRIEGVASQEPALGSS